MSDFCARTVVLLQNNYVMFINKIISGKGAISWLEFCAELRLIPFSRLHEKVGKLLEEVI